MYLDFLTEFSFALYQINFTNLWFSSYSILTIELILFYKKKKKLNFQITTTINSENIHVCV